MSIQNLIKFCPFILKIWSKNQSLTPIKGRNSVVNMRKTRIYYTNVDFVNDSVYTNFGFNLSIRSQNMKQKPNSDINQGPLLCYKFAKETMIYNTMVDLVNDNEYTKFGLNRSIRFQVMSSIGAGLAPMTSQNGGQDGGYGSNPSPVKGHDL